ncbi:penicillin-binding protein 1A [Herbaspirillum sp. RTI4]|nr:penicillin-binding protein 1A [Herbaspirillum sp. RTI4]MDY7577459.1 penicillin-binding protein 1A [Herbaspirillum sp. RTI4]MEA9981735.1 penicillin-binding protein 1A [Herbaspirillum sp. RTI4]
MIGGLVLTLVLIGALITAYALIVMRPQLPALDVITDYQPKVPLRIYSADHVLLGEFGEEKRSLVKLADIPANMKNAVLAIEDARFYQHGGVDYLGLVRAVGADLIRGGAKQGASTITMQVARNVFLSNEKTLTRKIYEVLLAGKIEAAMSKDDILQLYMNQIYLGQRAFGFAAAARVYFGKELKDITLAQAAMLAGLPKAPSAYNPVVNPKRAQIRQQYILKRMLGLEYITQQQYDAAMAEDIQVKAPGSQYNVHAEYVNEMVRLMMYAQYKEDTYTRGISVTTTIKAEDQRAAYDAVRKGVLDYDRRHGYRGPEGNIVLPSDEDDRQDAIDDVLDNHPDDDTLLAAVVTEVSPKQVKAMLRNDTEVVITGDGLRFAAAGLSPKASAALRIQPGAIIRVVLDAKKNWQITQAPQVQATLIALTPQDGAIRALVGGFDFAQSKFNHATQAWRQPGSTFKPFIYSAALEKGYGPASIVNDASVSYPAGPGQDNWEPRDDDPPAGPTPIRTALQKSVNLVAIRLLAAIGVNYAQEFTTQHFGFDIEKTPPYLPLALGAGQTTPLQLAAAYAVFANGGYTVNPYLISEVTDTHGKILSKAQPLIAEQNAPRAIDARNSYIMTSMLQSVAQRGTAAGSNVLHRTDLAGKTGTTNDAVDGWFAGYQRSLTAVAWMGYDQPKSLGSKEFGAQLALPIWVEYMGRALKNVPQQQMPMPAGITVINGEPYYDNFTPGNGFVESLGVEASSFPAAVAEFFGFDKPAAAPANNGSGNNEPAPPASRGRLYDGH